MLIFKLENKEKQIISCSNNFISNSVSNPNFNLNSQQYIDKIDSIKKEQHKGQNILLTDLLNKLVKNSFPIDYKILANKFLKIREIENSDCLEVMTQKINENIEMYCFY